MVDAYHKSPSYNQVERIESRLTFSKMREKYGESKIDEIGNYIHETHESHKHYAKGGMFGAGRFASGGELVDKTIDHDGRYLHLVGNHRMLHIHLNNEGREMIMDERESGRGDEEIMYDLFEDIVGNSTLMYHTDLGESGFGMTSSSGVTYDYGYDDNGDLVPLDDNAVVYVDNDSYRRSPVEELLEGRLIMRNSDFMARGGVTSDREYKKRIAKFGFKPYGKTKGVYTVTYMADGIPQTEKKKSKEMAIDTAKRYSSSKLADIFSDVKVIDESGNEVSFMARGGKLAGAGQFAKGTVLKMGKDDFSFLLGLSDKELSKRLDLIRKQQGINGEQYLKAREKGESTKAIEEAGERLAKQERAIIEARMRK
jgi:hypothetical protein